MNSPYPLLLNPDLPLLLLLSISLIPAPAIIYFPHLRAIEPLLLEALIDFVVYCATPHLCCFPPADLRRVLLEDLLEMRGAIAAGVETSKKVDIGGEGGFFGRGGVERVRGQGGVE